jgi:hypothetical protein
VIREERLLAEPVKHLLHMAGYITKCEAHFLQYSIDVYGAGTDHDDTVAVELKLDAWAKAIRQARVYQLCATYVYIALPAYNVHRVDKEQLRNLGIGLITVEERGSRMTARRVVQADVSRIRRERHMERVMHQLGDISDAE